MSAFEDFIQAELPRRPWVVNDPDQETIPVRRGAGPRQLEFVSLNDGEVLGKLSGVIQGVVIPGLTGSPATIDGTQSYVHTQSVLATTWTVTHNIGSEDFVALVFDDTGAQIISDELTATDSNTVIVEFNSQQTGKVVLIFA